MLEDSFILNCQIKTIFSVNRLFIFKGIRIKKYLVKIVKHILLINQISNLLLVSYTLKFSC